MSKITGKRAILTAIVGIVLLVVGFAAGYEYKAYEVRKALKDAFNVSDNAETNKKSFEDGKEGKETVSHDKNETVSYATMTMKFNSARAAKTITAQYSEPWTAQAGTKFVIVDHTVTNTGNSPFMYRELQLYDKDGRRYTASGDAIGKIDKYLNVKELAPGVPETGVLVYVVPETTSDFEFGGLNASTDKIDVVKFTAN